MTQQNNNNINSQPTTIGERIEYLRKSHKLKSKEAAQKFYVSAPEWSRIERGDRTPSLELIKAMCKEWNVPSDYLLFGEEHTEDQVYVGDLLSSQRAAVRQVAEAFRNTCRTVN